MISQHKQHSVGGGIYALLIFGILLMAAPIALSIAMPDAIGPLVVGVMLLSGLLFSAFSSTLIVIAKLYVRTKANEAFVRTGKGGMEVIMDGGAIVIPMIHEVVRVPLETIRLEVGRSGPDALITSDKLRADIRTEFFVRVEPKDESVKAAARSLGSRMGDEAAVRLLVEDKLISSLRNAASTRTLEELNSNRESFTKAVEESIKNDLAHNGLTLESVTISKLDQTDPSSLKENNIFDAQGLKTIAKITQEALTERNLLIKTGEREREQQNVETKKQTLVLQQEQAQAEAAQAANVAIIKAEQAQHAQTKQIEADREIQIARQRQEQAVQIAEQDKQQAVKVAEQATQRAIDVAMQAKEQAVEVAMRDKLAAIADAEKSKAIKEAEKNNAEAKREEAAQSIVTVQTKAKADREREVAVINAEAAARKLSLEANQKADADAYRVLKDAEARKAAADAEAEATRKKAAAEAEAAFVTAENKARAAQVTAEAEAAATLALKRAEADGAKALVEAETAKAMIPVETKRAEVAIDRERVEVTKNELEAREKHGRVGQEFELAKLRIESETTVRVESAKAFAQMHSKMDVTVLSTADDVVRMNNRILQGLGIASAANGFLAGAGDETVAAAGTAIQAAHALVERVSSKKDGANGAEKA